MAKLLDIFKEFQVSMINMDKKGNRGSNFNYLQETYAKTELFDISLLEDKSLLTTVPDCNDKFTSSICVHETLKEVSIPFESMFIKVQNGQYIYLHEFAPNIITGSSWNLEGERILNLPFTIYTNKGEVVIPFITKLIKDTRKDLNDLTKVTNSKQLKVHTQEFVLHSHTCKSIINTLKIVTSLPKHSVISDTPTTNHVEYYRRKKASTIKVINRPIYYVLNKSEEKEKKTYNRINPIGKLEFSHSFKVRGHWRTIGCKSYGKNRNNEYVVLGYTWVKECIKGTGELTRRLRVIK